MIWQTELLECIMNIDFVRVAKIAKELNDPELLQKTLERKSISKKYIVFVFAGELYSPEGGIRHVVGGDFKFEHESRRAEIGSWLDMIGAKTGDTLLHLALRLSGCEDYEKVRSPH